VSAFTIDQTSGAVAAIALPVSSTSPQSIAVDLSGQFSYVAIASGTVTAFAINQTTGVLSGVAGSLFAEGKSLRDHHRRPVLTN
jgi:6-phosphogluconolactonase (cycloisomerase 2 family)